MMTQIYPQAQPIAEEEFESFLERPLIAKLCTHNQDGSIHIAPVWFRYEDGEMLMGTQEITRKISNIKQNDQVTVLVDTTDPTLKGVIMVGIAQLEYDDVIAKRVTIFEKYVDEPEALAKRLASSWTPVIIRVKPQQVTTFDYSQGFGIELELQGVEASS